MHGLTLINVDDRIVPAYRGLSQPVHDEGRLMLAQLAHVGAMETSGNAILSASPTDSEISPGSAHDASPDELAEVAAMYRAVAGGCAAGRLDGVEITRAWHAARELPVAAHESAP